MKTYLVPRPARRVPAFHPVPLRARADGWTPLRQAEFLGHLAVTRSVSAAARAVGMARETAYRLRRRADAASFAAAWDAVLGFCPSGAKVTLPDLRYRVDNGLWRPVVRRGQVLGAVQRADNIALLAMLVRIDRAEARARQALEGHDTKSREECAAPCPAPGLAPT
ncbi:hypothetical protein [Novosphingobium sp.]|uniref:hypothetical protein n=1 Tax=Novosphingobium sp. TaxID=1874826 RepID=UPI001ECEE337|nr:hypothetical protein [Novosphingobium sp.]MBK6800487.1 hypothetical protein [Novosphingobium sp.]MBK9011075.1 hypothetical protein [Novosphingobium sp.]